MFNLVICNTCNSFPFFYCANQVAFCSQQCLIITVRWSIVVRKCKNLNWCLLLRSSKSPNEYVADLVKYKVRWRWRWTEMEMEMEVETETERILERNKIKRKKTRKDVSLFSHYEFSCLPFLNFIILCIHSVFLQLRSTNKCQYFLRMSGLLVYSP